MNKGMEKPFYNSTAFVSLDKISEESYSAFIRRLFSERQHSMTDEALQLLLEEPQNRDIFRFVFLSHWMERL